jgi:hypothetical protein
MEHSSLRMELGNFSEEDMKTAAELLIRFTSQNIYEEKKDLQALFADMPLPDDVFVATFEVDPKYTEAIADVLNSKVINQEPSLLLPELFLFGHEEKKYQIYFLQNPALEGKLFMLVIPETVSAGVLELKEHLIKILGDLSKESFVELFFQSSTTLEELAGAPSKKLEAFFKNSFFEMNISNDKKIGNLLNAFGKRIKDKSEHLSQLMKTFHALLNALDEFNLEMKLKSPEEIPENLREQWASEQSLIGLIDGLSSFLKSVVTPDSKTPLMEFVNSFASSPDVRLSLISQGLGCVDVNLKLPGLSALF